MIREKRTLTAPALRQLCIDNNWYTRGNCEEYSELFDMLVDENFNPKNITTEILQKIAENIIEHSDMKFDTYRDWTVTGTMYEINQKCNIFFLGDDDEL